MYCLVGGWNEIIPIYMYSYLHSMENSLLCESLLLTKTHMVSVQWTVQHVDTVESNQPEELKTFWKSVVSRRLGETNGVKMNLHEADNEEDGGYTVLASTMWTVPKPHVRRT